MPRPIQALIHLNALSHNLQRVRQIRPDARLWAVVKANAYGHHIENVYPALRAADGFAVLDLSEAERLRALGWRGPILLLEGVFNSRDLETCSRLGLAHTIHCDAQIDWLAMHKTTAPHHVYLKMNTGMNRLGFTPQHYRGAWARLNSLPQVAEIGLMMHFSDADGPIGIAAQLASFNQTAADLPGERSLCNSAAIFAHPEAASDWCRPGIALYGASFDYPTHNAQDWKLLPAMTLQTQIIGVQQLEPGATVGYGSIFTARQSMRIGIAACGYADGYPRIAPTGTPVLIDGIRSATVGRVSMDMLAVDLSSLPNAGLGSTVTLWGQGPHASYLSIDEVALAGQTLGYELMCALTSRVPIKVVD